MSCCVDTVQSDSGSITKTLPSNTSSLTSMLLFVSSCAYVNCHLSIPEYLELDHYDRGITESGTEHRRTKSSSLLMILFISSDLLPSERVVQHGTCLPPQSSTSPNADFLSKYLSCLISPCLSLLSNSQIFSPTSVSSTSSHQANTPILTNHGLPLLGLHPRAHPRVLQKTIQHPQTRTSKKGRCDSPEVRAGRCVERGKGVE